MVCQPAEVTAFTPSTTTDRRVGTSVAIASYGASPGFENTSRLLVSGAPGDPFATDSRVYVSAIDLSTGEVDTASPLNQTLTPQTGGTIPTTRHFGAAVIPVDARECHSVGAFYNACGEELAVGAPDLANDESTKGLVQWFEPQGTVNGAYAYGGLVAPPASYPIGAQFGYSLATAPRPPVLTNPWEVAPRQPSDLIVGAPGNGTAVAYRVVRGMPDPFIFAREFAGSSTARFGEAVAAADFDGDGLVDVAVGAPVGTGGDPSGRVHVYKNLGYGAYGAAALILDGHALLAPAAPNEADEFGSALAAGNLLRGPDSSPWPAAELVVGAPGHLLNGTTTRTGGVCVFHLIPSATDPSGLALGAIDCFTNPYGVVYPATDERFGAAVAVGNYQAVDGRGALNNEASLLEELAVGRPGADAARGAVAVLSGGKTSLDVHTGMTVPAQLYQYPSRVVSAQFGAALAPGYTQNSPWQDVAVGAPEHATGAHVHGSTSATAAYSLPSTCSEVVGDWDETTPSAGDGIVTWEELGEVHVNFVDGLEVTIRDGYGTGAVCEVDGCKDDPAVYDPTDPSTWCTEVVQKTLTARVSGGFTLDVPAVWDCTTHSVELAGMDVTALLTDLLQSKGLAVALPSVTGDVKLVLTPGTPDELEVTIENVGDNGFWGLVDLGLALQLSDTAFTDDCRIERISIHATLAASDVCDPL